MNDLCQVGLKRFKGWTSDWLRKLGSEQSDSKLMLGCGLHSYSGVTNYRRFNDR